LLEILLEGGADVNARTEQGYTALMAAGVNDRWDLVERLKQAGATE
jgi:ankyrin repeat protein